MPRILKLLIPLAIFLGLPFLLDERVQPSRTAADGETVRPIADRTAVVGYRYHHYDPVSGALVFELKGDRAVEEPAPAGSQQRRFTLEKLWVRVAAKPGHADAFTPLELTAPHGAVRFGEGGDTLVNLEGGVRGDASDGTTLTTEQIRITVAEKSGVLSEARAPSAIQVRGPGLSLDAASGSYIPEAGWKLDGPVTGTVTERELTDPKATEELKRSAIGLTAPQGVVLSATLDPAVRMLTTDGGLYVDRRAVASGPIQSILTGQKGVVVLERGAMKTLRLRNDVRAAAFGADGACNLLLAAAAAEWDPIASQCTLTGHPRWYLRSGAEVWIPGASKPGALPDQSLGPKGAPAGWMGSARQSAILTRSATDGALTIAMRDAARVAAVPLAAAHVATRALAPIPEQARASAPAVAAHLVNRNLGASAVVADAEVRAERLDVVMQPREGRRQVVDFDAAGQIEIKRAGSNGLTATGESARGRIVTEGASQSINGELRDRAQLQLLLSERLESGRVLHLRSTDPGGAIVFESTQTGAQRTARARSVGAVRIQEVSADGPVGRWEASHAEVDLERGSDGYERTEVRANGSDGAPIRFTAAAARGGAKAVMDEIRVERIINQPGGGGNDVVRWAGLRDGFAPAGVRLELGGRGGTLPGDPGSAWTIDAESGSIERTLVQRDTAWEATHSTVRLDPGSAVSLKPATDGAGGFTFSGRGPTTLEFVHRADEAGVTRAVLERASSTGGADFRSSTAHVAGDTIAMQSEKGAQRWVITGAPAMAKFKAGSPLPLTDTRVPGGTGAGTAPWFDARAERIELRRTVNPLTGLTRDVEAKLSGDPVVGQLPAGGEAGPEWPVPEWELRSPKPLWLSWGAEKTVLKGSGGVRLVNYDAAGRKQGVLRAPGVVVESDAGGGSTATFGAPFVAEGVTAAEAFAELGEPGGGDPVKADRVRLVSRDPVTVSRRAGSSHVRIETPELNLLPLNDAGDPVRAVRIPKGLKVIPSKDGSWTFAFLGGSAAAIPLEATELEELAKLANNR